jgi:ArsR family transcriptional regulator, arsenate/arsenite/antimonite-responsive transcriptional repressor
MIKSISIIEKHKEIAKISEALSHPIRVAILEYILKQENCLCKDLTARLPIVQSSVSQHLKKLKNAGLIIGSIDGTKTCYCANKERVKDIISIYNGAFQVLDHNDFVNCYK